MPSYHRKLHWWETDWSLRRDLPVNRTPWVRLEEVHRSRLTPEERAAEDTDLRARERERQEKEAREDKNSRWVGLVLVVLVVIWFAKSQIYHIIHHLRSGAVPLLVGLALVASLVLTAVRIKKGKGGALLLLSIALVIALAFSLAMNG